MLKIPTEYPNPGSEALFRSIDRVEEIKVRIVSIDDDGRAFVTSKGVTARVEMERLRPFAEPRAAIDLWADMRVASVTGSTSTPAGDAWADFKSWFARTYQADTTINPTEFKHALQRRGFVLNRGRGLHWAFALAPERIAA